MSPDDLIEAINNPDVRKIEETSESENMGCLSFLDQVFGDAAAQCIFYGLGAVGFWFISQRWSWFAFLIVGLLFMFGIPAYFLLKRK